ncbi:hypothetical protein ACI79C_05440 [Geodermatophilus sp. SYSU D00697]
MAGVTCPQPLGVVEGPHPGFRMSRIEGQPLMDHLARTELSVERLGALAAAVATALRLYVETVGEPYHDLKLDNVMLEPSGALAFLDFGRPLGHVPSDGVDALYESSVANLLASLVFESARPKRLANRRLHRQSASMATALVVALADRGSALDPERLLHEARRAYVRSTFGRRSVARTAWYATVGWAVGRRVRLSDGRFGPVPLWGR